MRNILLSLLVSLLLLMNFNSNVQAVGSYSHDSTTSNSSKSPLCINISTSKICGLVYFVDTITGHPHTTGEVREWYLTQKSEDPKLDKEICKRYSNCLDEAGNKYDTRDPTGRQMTLSQRIACMAIECESLDELLNSLKTILPSEISSTLAAAYKHFEPIYESCIWTPRYKRLTEQLEEFRIGVKRVELLTKLERVRKFMRATWPEKMPFKTIVIPLPDEPRSSHADSVGKTQIVEIIAKHTFDDQSDTLFHELCHSLWGRTDQEKIRKQFERIGGSAGYYELDEALATALGQGWFRQTAYPVEPPRDVWYGRDITENYGRGLFPLVSIYLHDGRRFDSSFVRQALQTFREKCPQAEMDVIHTYAVHITSENTPDYDTLQTAIFAAMPSIRMTDWSTLASANFARKAKSAFMQCRQIVLLSPEAIDLLTKHGLTNAQVTALKKRSADCVSVTLNHSDIIFCVGKDVRSQENVFLEMLKNGYPRPAG